MFEDRKNLYDLPEHALEQIVTILSKDTSSLNKFYGFGLSSKLFHRPTIRALDKENIYFPMDIGKDASNMTLMKYISCYDEDIKGKFGLKIVSKNSKNLEKKIYNWVAQCSGFKKLFFDKVDFRVPACIDNVRQIFLQNLPTIETLKIQNVVSDPEGIGKIEGLVAACKKLKDLEIIWNLKYFEDEPARAFKYSLFDIFDNTPSIETFRLVAPNKCIDRDDGKECAGPGQSLIVFDIELRFFYQKTGFSLQRPQNILPLSNQKAQIRKNYYLNGEKQNDPRERKKDKKEKK